MPIEVRVDDLSSPAVQALIAEHLADMHRNSPPCRTHALALDSLRRPEIRFWSAWLDDELCGCGALKALSDHDGEVKSMRTRAGFARRGVGQAVLDTILATAQARGYQNLYLETGTGPAFDAAHAFYLRNGFDWCAPFGDYEATEFNVFMVRAMF